VPNSLRRIGHGKYVFRGNLVHNRVDRGEHKTAPLTQGGTDPLDLLPDQLRRTVGKDMLGIQGAAEYQVFTVYLFKLCKVGHAARPPIG